MHPTPASPTRQTSSALVTVCMICHHTIGPDHRAADTHLPVGATVSHGLCRDCAPGYGRQMGLTDSQIAQVISRSTAIH